MLDADIGSMEEHNVRYKQSDNEQGIDNGISAYEIENYVVWSAVASHQKHVVVIEDPIGNVCGNAEAAENGKGNW